MNDWLTIALAAGLTARATRLITLDTITQPIRSRLSGLIGALVECAWCTGVWMAVPVGLSWAAWADQTWWQVTALIATLAWVAGAVSGAAMPSQHEVATVSPVALVNADEPPPEPPAASEATGSIVPPERQVVVLRTDGDDTDGTVAELAQALSDRTGDSGSADRIETALRRYLGAGPHAEGQG